MWCSQCSQTHASFLLGLADKLGSGNDVVEGLIFFIAVFLWPESSFSITSPCPFPPPLNIFVRLMVQKAHTYCSFVSYVHLLNTPQAKNRNCNKQKYSFKNRNSFLSKFPSINISRKDRKVQIGCVVWVPCWSANLQRYKKEPGCMGIQNILLSV